MPAPVTRAEMKFVTGAALVVTEDGALAGPISERLMVEAIASEPCHVTALDD